MISKFRCSTAQARMMLRVAATGVAVMVASVAGAAPIVAPISALRTINTTITGPTLQTTAFGPYADGQNHTATGGSPSGSRNVSPNQTSDISLLNDAPSITFAGRVDVSNTGGGVSNQGGSGGSFLRFNFSLPTGGVLEHTLLFTRDGTRVNAAASLTGTPSTVDLLAPGNTSIALLPGLYELNLSVTGSAFWAPASYSEFGRLSGNISFVPAPPTACAIVLVAVALRRRRRSA